MLLCNEILIDPVDTPAKACQASVRKRHFGKNRSQDTLAPGMGGLAPLYSRL